jgi:glyoxylase-like metal-dependent hydrolase (beta-lactamase superfamily II)
VIEDLSVPVTPNVGFVVGETGVLVIDTGLGERNGATVLAEAQAVAPGRDIYIVSTHFHPEHDLGAQAFPDDAQMIRSNDQAAEIVSNAGQTIELFAGRSAVMAELLEGAEHRDADILFEDEHVLDLGGVTATIMALGANHTSGDTGVWVESDGVLFSGDVAMRNLPNVGTADATLGQWFASLDRFDALGPEIIVPSHGPLGGAAYVADYRAFFTLARDRAAELKAEGKSVEEAVEIITAELEAAHPQIPSQRAGSGIRLAYNEAP